MEFTKRELFNLKQSSISLKDVIDREINVIKVGESTKEIDGVNTTIYFLIDDKGISYSTISSVFGNSVSDLQDIINEEGSALIKICTSKSKTGRNFIYAELV